MTINIIQLIVGFFVGIGLGIFYFGGLWLTVNKLFKAGSPNILFLLSFVIRMSLIVIGFYFVMNNSGLQQTIFCLIGFLLARQALLKYHQAIGTKIKALI